jgi:sporulation integral membrane protein YtvI
VIFSCKKAYIFNDVLKVRQKMESKKIPRLFLYCALAALCFFLGFKYALPAALPFIAAFFIASAARGAAGLFVGRECGAKRCLSLFFGLFFFAAAGFISFLCLSRLWGELSALARGAMDAREEITKETQKFFRALEGLLLRFFPGAEGGADALRARIELFAQEALKSVISEVSTKIPAFMAMAFSAVPKILFSLGITLISCIYLCLDYAYVRARCEKLLSRFGSPVLARVPRTSFFTAAKYLRALFIIFLLTAAVLTVGFLFLGVKYAFALAALTAFIDALPVFGSGAVLLPYAAFLLLSGDFGRGAGFIFLWCALFLLRQLTEPKIMGESLGVHPLVSLAAVYVGASFFGITGVIFLPITVVILKNLLFTEERSEQ